MHATGDSNLERLLGAGVLATDDLPTPHLRVVEGLTQDEVDVLISVKKRLEAADEWHGVDPPVVGEQPHFSILMPY